jgi:replicative DNA helicase
MSESFLPGSGSGSVPATDAPIRAPRPDPLSPAKRAPVEKRVPPQDLDAERAVLAAMLLDNHAVNTAAQILSSDDFYRPAHRLICTGTFNLFTRGEAIDLVTLSDEMTKSETLERAGGEIYLAELLDSTVTAANVEYHARIVREKSLLRRMIDAARRIAEEAYSTPEDVNSFVDRAEHLMFEISESGPRTGFTPVKEILVDSFEAIEELYQNKRLITGVPTGFLDLDTLTSGFQPSEFVVIAARPTMGKTAFTLNIAQHVAVEHGLPVAFFSLEMSKESLVHRMLACEARVDGNRLRTGFLRENEWPRLTTAAGKLGDAEFYIDDTAGLSALEVRAKARRLKLETDGRLAMIAIDYLQLMRGHGRQENRQQEISSISRSLKALAKELKIPVVALSQLKRPTDVREGARRPMLSDLRESGAIEQDADVVLFINRPEVYNPTPDNEGIAEIIIGKQRNGPIGITQLQFQKSFTRFENLSRMKE